MLLQDAFNWTIFVLLFGVHSVKGFPSCSPDPCKNGGYCVSDPRDSSCRCTDLHAGEYCQFDNPCRPQMRRCMNGGRCSVLNLPGGVDAACECPLGFEGMMCEVPRQDSACTRRPCKNGGTCRLVGNLSNFTCDCPVGYMGRLCERLNACDPNPCEYSGVCRTDGNNFKCDCLPSLRGRTCTEDVNECLERPVLCHNGGTCQNLHGSYRCLCHPRYTGLNCEVPYIPCSPSPCQNGGSCVQTGSYSYDCRCTEGFQGNDCQVNINDCVNHECKNGARCIDKINSYQCSCPPEWTGNYIFVLYLF